MNRNKLDLRSWILITISFAVGMLVSEFVDYRWQQKVDDATSLVSQDLTAAAGR